MTIPTLCALEAWGGLGSLQRPMYCLLRAPMVLIKVREHFHLRLWWFSESFVQQTFKNVHYLCLAGLGGLQHPIQMY